MYELAERDPLRKDANGVALLDLADSPGGDKVLYHMKGCGFEVNKRTVNDDAPLHQAIRMRNAKHVKTLLSLGADPTMTMDGLAPVKWSALNGDREVTKVLIEHMEKSSRK